MSPHHRNVIYPTIIPTLFTVLLGSSSSTRPTTFDEIYCLIVKYEIRWLPGVDVLSWVLEKSPPVKSPPTTIPPNSSCSKPCRSSTFLCHVVVTGPCTQPPYTQCTETFCAPEWAIKDIPTMKVVCYRDSWYTLDNSRLWLLHHGRRPTSTSSGTPSQSVGEHRLDSHNNSVESINEHFCIPSQQETTNDTTSTNWQVRWRRSDWQLRRSYPHSPLTLTLQHEANNLIFWNNLLVWRQNF